MAPVSGSAMAESRAATSALPSRDAAASDTRAREMPRTARAEARAAILRLTHPLAERIAYIDMARGLFLVLMASTHAMTLAGIPATSALGRWGLPRGWASTGLTMLCGFMVATLCRQMVDRVRIRKRVVRRAKQLLVVMFASNVVMVTVRHLVSHETKPLFTVAWWWQFLVLGTEWSISGVLLPIALFLLISPALVRVLDAGRSRLHAVVVAAAVTVCTGSAWSVPVVAGDSLASHHVLDVLFGNGLGGFPVVPIITSGALGFLVGRVWQPLRDRFDMRSGLIIVVFFVAAGQLTALAPAIVGPMLTRTVVDLSHFLLIMTLALALTRWNTSLRACAFVSALGSSSLLTFLLHRVVEQMLNLGLQPLDVPRELVYVVCMTGGVFGSVGVISLRRRFVGWNRAFRAVYL
jgi:hypothetical protein